MSQQQLRVEGQLATRRCWNMSMLKTTVLQTVASTTLEQSCQLRRSQYSNVLRLQARRPISVYGVKKTSCMLTTDQKSAYERDGMLRKFLLGVTELKLAKNATCLAKCAGYLVIRNFTSPEQLRELQNRGVQLIDGFDPEQVSVFSTKNQVKTQLG